MTQFYEERQPQQDQPYPDPQFGHRADQGTIEESVHRRVTKRMDHSRTPGLPDLTPPRPWAPIVIALCSLALACAAIAFTWVSHNSASTQVSQLRAQVTGLSQEVQAARNTSASTSTVKNLTGKVNAIATVVSGISAYSNVCSQDLTGSNGQPAVFLFPCAQKP